MNPFQQLKHKMAQRIISPYLPCIPGRNTRTCLVEGKQAPIEVYNGKSKGRPSLVGNYIKGGYKFSEERKKEIFERTFNRKKQQPLFDAVGWLDGVFCKQLKINTL